MGDQKVIPKCGTPLVHEFLHGHPTTEIGELFSEGDSNSDQLDLLARPTGLDKSYDSGFLRFHYTLDGNNAVDPSDSDGDGSDGKSYISYGKDGIADYYEALGITYEYQVDINDPNWDGE